MKQSAGKQILQGVKCILSLMGLIILTFFQIKLQTLDIYWFDCGGRVSQIFSNMLHSSKLCDLKLGENNKVCTYGWETKLYILAWMMPVFILQTNFQHWTCLHSLKQPAARFVDKTNHLLYQIYYKQFPTLMRKMVEFSFSFIIL